MTVEKALPVAIREFTSPAGETFTEFKKEYEKLTPEDRQWFRERIAVEFPEITLKS